MSIVAFDGRYILSDSICVDDAEYQFKADKVFSHTLPDGTVLVGCFTGSLSIGSLVAQWVFDHYDRKSLRDRIAFQVGVEIKAERRNTDIYIIDYAHGKLFSYCCIENAFTVLPLQSFTMGFSSGVAIVEAERLRGSDHATIVQQLEAYTNSVTVNARFVAPPYYLTDTKTGLRTVVE